MDVNETKEPINQVNPLAVQVAPAGTPAADATNNDSADEASKEEARN